MVTLSHHRRRGLRCVVALVFLVVVAALMLAPAASAEDETTTAPAPTATVPTATTPAPTATTAPVPAAPADTSTAADDDCAGITDVVLSPIDCTVGAVGDSFMDSLVTAFASALERVVMMAMSWWIEALPVSELALTETSPGSGLLGDINSKLVPIQLIGMTVSVLFFASRMAWNRKQSLTDDAEDGFKLVLRASLAVTFVPAAVITGGAVGDEFGSWLIRQAIEDSTGGAVKKLLVLNVLTGPSGLGSGLLLILFLVGILGMLLQLFFLAIRTAMLIVIVAALPVAASFSGTGVGSQAYSKMIGWSIAFCLFKPIGALCYYIAFKAGGAGATVEQAVIGMLLLIMAGFVLPSLMRLIGATGSMGSGASGASGLGMAVGAVVTAGSLAAGGAGAGAGAAGTGASLGARGRGAGGGGGTGGGSSGGGGGGRPSPPAPNPPVGPGGRDSGGGDDSGGGQSSGDGGRNPLTSVGGGAAGTGASSTDRAASGEADASAAAPPGTPPPPRMQSGWGEHQMIR